MVPTAPEIPLAVLNEAILAAAPPVVPQTSVIDEWWFWTIIGVVVVGAGVGLYFGISAALAPSGPAPGTLGEGHL